MKKIKYEVREMIPGVNVSSVVAETFTIEEAKAIIHDLMIGGDLSKTADFFKITQITTESVDV